MVWRAPHKAIRQLGPSRQGFAALYEFRIGAGQLPAAVDAVAAAGRDKRHALNMFRHRLEVVQPRCRAHSIAVGGMRNNILNQLSIEIDRTPIAQAVDMVSTGFHRLYSSSW